MKHKFTINVTVNKTSKHIKTGSVEVQLEGEGCALAHALGDVIRTDETVRDLILHAIDCSYDTPPTTDEFKEELLREKQLPN